MQLSKQNLKSISSTGVIKPTEGLFSLPEKILQFGTGVLLRGLPDYFIDKANRQGIFNGRVVVVKSTDHGKIDAFAPQDNLYTLCVKGIEDNKETEEFIINSSISRVLAANDNWSEVLQCAYNSELKIVISNTTEVGIKLIDDNIHLNPPKSFPGKLLAFLVERYKAFGGQMDKGMIIVPTELITANAAKLKAIVLELARKNKLDPAFMHWLQEANHFCNSLVDRIVPGQLPPNEHQEVETKLGYTDGLMIMAEPFRLWAIETGSRDIADALAFAKADEGVVIAPDIEKFRELKLRLLNGTHTFSCGLAFLAGFGTVKEAMNDAVMSLFIHNIAVNEIAVAISNGEISYNEACIFANKVMDRFRNPFIDHQWLNISVQYSSKMKLRNVPLLEEHYKKHNNPPANMALGFAGYLYFMKCQKGKNGVYEGNINGLPYPVEDDAANWYAEIWKNNDPEEVVKAVFVERDFWETDLLAFNGFADAVKLKLVSLIKNGIMSTLRETVLNKTVTSS